MATTASVGQTVWVYDAKAGYVMASVTVPAVDESITVSTAKGATITSTLRGLKKDLTF